MKLLHIYAQEFWHETAVIAGNIDALTALRTAIDAALLMGKDSEVSTNVECSDGEGYQVRVVCVESESKWESFRLPYTAEHTHGSDNLNNRHVP